MENILKGNPSIIVQGKAYKVYVRNSLFLYVLGNIGGLKSKMSRTRPS